MLGTRVGALLIYAQVTQPHTGHRHVTTAQMTEDRRLDPVPRIVASGREIARDDVEMLWSDLISARYTWQETSERALALIETVNVPEHIVNWGLMDLYYLWWPGAARDVESHRLSARCGGRSCESTTPTGTPGTTCTTTTCWSITPTSSVTARLRASGNTW
jgi:hypothetical protein